MTTQSTSNAASATGRCPYAGGVGNEFSFFKGGYQQDPAGSLSWARANEPVFHDDETGYWVVTRHDDVKKVFSDSASFSAAVTLAPVTPPSQEAGEILGKYGFGPTPVLVDSDQPVHRKIRRLNAPVFMPENIDPLEGFIRDTTNTYIDRFVDRGHADLIADLLWDLPCLIALEFLGVPDEDVDTVRLLATSMTEFLWGQPSPEDELRAADGLGKFWAMGGRIVDKLKELENPPGWIGHTIKLQREYPDLFPDSYLQTNVMGGTMAAHETTTNATANALVTLLRNREQWEAICRDPSLIPGVVEECLRHSGSVVAWRRKAKTDVEVGGTMIPEGANVLMVIASANYDEQVFEAPDDFDPERMNNSEHVAFGHGPHMCLGNHLARLEMRVFLEELTRRLPGMRLTDQDFRYMPNTSFRGPEELRVSWDLVREAARGSADA
jgi:cytochrome P450